MYNIGYAIKQHLLSDTAITAKTIKIYNVVAMTIDNQTQPPYIVIDIDNITPNAHKDLYNYDDVEFSVNILAKQYDECVELTELVRASLEYKTIDTGTRELGIIMYTDYSEAFDSNYILYRTRLSFITKSFTINN